ncbi:hypothetical protein C0Q70_11860 [Pomacea canaliculata]|uniref:Uncharacterized protein n=1 Tax=Pomacea canaliculata TaxID=400727 RepID=A0A2T7P793_POMCA|nr:uncharacterized protein LOC112567195 [Pomacea canaliculata]PVD29263.1 hypothetical protein C0Q70_11860 [Pomacea canaliculata]
MKLSLLVLGVLLCVAVVLAGGRKEEKGGPGGRGSSENVALDHPRQENARDQLRQGHVTPGHMHTGEVALGLLHQLNQIHQKKFHQTLPRQLNLHQQPTQVSSRLDGRSPPPMVGMKKEASETGHGAGIVTCCMMG